MKATYKKGDIIWVNFGKPPLEIKGHEQGFTRPCIVIKSLDHLELAIVLPLTTSKQHYTGYSVVKINKNTFGLTEDSYVLCHQIKTISFKRIVGQRIGTVDTKTQLKIEAVLIDLLEMYNP